MKEHKGSACHRNLPSSYDSGAQVRNRGCSLTDRLKLRATRSPAQGRGTKSVPRQGHNTPLPLERAPPGSFKRLLGRRTLVDERYETSPRAHESAVRLAHDRQKGAFLDSNPVAIHREGCESEHGGTGPTAQRQPDASVHENPSAIGGMADQRGGPRRDDELVRVRASVPRQGHNTPLPLKRSPPGSFKRMLDGALFTDARARRAPLGSRARLWVENLPLGSHFIEGGARRGLP